MGNQDKYANLVVCDEGASEKIIEAYGQLSVVDFKKELQATYGWSPNSIDLLFQKYENISEIKKMLSLIQQEYLQYGAVCRWEQPTSQYLYTVLSNPESEESKESNESI